MSNNLTIIRHYQVNKFNNIYCIAWRYWWALWHTRAWTQIGPCLRLEPGLWNSFERGRRLRLSLAGVIFQCQISLNIGYEFNALELFRQFQASECQWLSACESGQVSKLYLFCRVPVTLKCKCQVCSLFVYPGIPWLLWVPWDKTPRHPL